jgi:hypothetical protein
MTLMNLGQGRVFTAFADRNFQTHVYEELTLPQLKESAVQAITYQPT